MAWIARMAQVSIQTKQGVRFSEDGSGKSRSFYFNGTIGAWRKGDDMESSMTKFFETGGVLPAGHPPFESYIKDLKQRRSTRRRRPPEF